MHAQEAEEWRKEWREGGILLELLKGPIPYRPLRVSFLDDRTVLGKHKRNSEE